MHPTALSFSRFQYTYFMLHHYLSIAFFCAFSLTTTGQTVVSPDGGGSYLPEQTACVSPAEYQRIHAMLAANINMLKANGSLAQDWGFTPAGTVNKPTAGSFIWPLQLQPGSNYNSYYGISGYVDLNPAFPNQKEDWNCGERTYDLNNGYNHQGIDIFLWPFAQQMQEQEQVAIIAAANGIIIAKEDGNFDKNCAMGNSQWNAVYIGNTDGTICWYGHMKSGTLTSKAVGQAVTAGEYLGIVGSSGSSTGPHLHFETHDGAGNVLEPFEGACNQEPSLWASQKPYFEPTINAVMTHSAAPVFPACPQLEQINQKDTFLTGESLITAAYFHDQQGNSPVEYKITSPDTTENITWMHASPVYYTASYWYWSYLVPSTWQRGVWTFSATYEGQTVSHDFVIGPLSTHHAGIASISKSLSLYPNPNKGNFQIRGIKHTAYPVAYEVKEITGRTLQTGLLQQTETTVHGHHLPAGMYLIRLTTAQGTAQSLKFFVE